MRNPMRSYMQAGPTPAPAPMPATMGTAIRGLFGGGRPAMPAIPPTMPTLSQGIGQTVRGMAQAPDRSGGIGQAVSAMRAPGAVNPVIRQIGARMGMGRSGR